MIKTYVRKYRIPLLILGGLLTGLTLVFPQVGILEWITLIPALAVMLDVCRDGSVKLKKVYLYGFVVLLSYYVVAFHWFCYMYPLEFAGIPKAAALGVVVVAWLGLAAFQAATMAFFAPLAALVVRCKYAKKASLLHPLLIAAAWTVFEWLQAHTGYVGVPWARLCMGQTDMLVMVQSASVLGSYFITFAILTVNGMIAAILLDASRKVAAAVVAGSMICANLGIGIVCLSIPTDTSSPLRVAAIQGNVSTSEKWTDESRGHTERIYRELSLQAAADGADVIVWPETALPYNLDRDYDMRMYLVQLARECDATLLVSLFTEDGVSGKLYNSVVSIDSSGNISETEYHKINLVPFGEFVPLRDLVVTIFPPLAELGMLDGDLLFGEGAQVFDTEQGRISSLICFDSIYEDNSLDSVCMGAQLLAVSTNDSWFSDSAAVYMHNAQSRLRAIETGRYVVRSANTGVSSIISSKGEVLEILPPLVDGYVISDVYLSDAKTPYLQIGNLFVYMCIVFVGAVLLCSPLERIMSGLRRKNS